MIRTIVVLTKAVTHNGPYVTGIDINTGRWVRLAKSTASQCQLTPNGDLQCKPMQYEDGGFCQVLDVIEADVETVSDGAEPDMVVYVSESLPRKLMKFHLRDVLVIRPSEKQDHLFGNCENSVSQEEYKFLKSHLALVEVSNLSINPHEGHHPKMDFWYNGIHFENIYVADNDYTSLTEHFHADNAALVMAVADDPYEGRHYKFIARVFTV